MKYLFLIINCFFFNLPIFSQDNVVITIGNKNITIEEFERLYKKNNTLFTGEKQDMEDYLERFINFKLKVIEAENQGIDTTKSFLDEFNTYRKELAKPYMTDSATLDQLLRHTYNKMVKEIQASHILINLNPKASPSDTLAAWNKIMNIRKRSVNGEDFTMLAKEFSDDPSAKTNGGELGWFGAFRMVYEFEEAAYSISPGEISMPVRTRFGYHIIKVHNVRPAIGSVQVAHIFIRVPQESSSGEVVAAKEKIFAIKDSLDAGISFEEMVTKYSDDRNSVTQGGLLPWFSTGMMIPEFENAAFALKEPGTVSDPVKSFYGWHLIRLIDKKTVGKFEEEREGLLGKMNAAHFSEVKRKAFINKLKSTYKFSLDQTKLEKFYSLVDTSVFTASWSSSVLPDPQQILFTIGNRNVFMGEFGKWIENRQRKMTPYNIQSFVNEEFTNFSDQVVYDYEESFLENKYPEFKYILQEYHDGILLFELTEREIWNKAIQDSAGLVAFFNQNHENYKWENRAEAFIVSLKDSSLVDDARKMISKYGKKKNFSKEMLAIKLCPDDTTGSCINIEKGKFEKGTDSRVDETGWEPGLGSNVKHNGEVTFVYIRKILPPSLKELDETRGSVISDYQEYLEKQWVGKLREKYPVKINREILSTIN